MKTESLAEVSFSGEELAGHERWAAVEGEKSCSQAHSQVVAADSSGPCAPEDVVFLVALGVWQCDQGGCVEVLSPAEEGHHTN